MGRANGSYFRPGKQHGVSGPGPLGALSGIAERGSGEAGSNYVTHSTAIPLIILSGQVEQRG